MKRGAQIFIDETTDKSLSQNSGAPDETEEYFSQFPQVRLVWINRGRLLRVALIAFLVSCIVSFLIPVRFESSVQLMPPDQPNNPGLSMISALVGGKSDGLGFASDLLGMKTSGALFVAILRSRACQDSVINKFDLRKVYSVRYYEQARKILTNRTVVAEDKKSGIIDIVVSDHDRVRAVAMAQAYVDELNRLVTQLTTSSARRERIFLEGRLRSVKEDLDSASVEFSQFASKNTAIDVPAQGKAMLESAARLQGELIAAQSELSGIEQIYTPNNVRIRALRARIDELQHQLEKVGGKDVGGGTATGNNDNLYPSIRQLPLLGVRYADLYRQVKIREAVYEALTKQYELAKVQEAKETPTVRMLAPPEIPERKSFPPRLIIMFFGTVFSLGLYIAYLIYARLWRTLSPEDPRRRFGEQIIKSLQIR